MFKHYNTYDFRTVEVGGEQMASLISRKDENGVIFDSSYQVKKTVDMDGFLPQWILDSLDEKEKLTNMHDFNVIDNGNRVLMLTKVFENATVEESRTVGFHGNCTAKWQGFKEVDVATSKPIFEWSAHGRIDLKESTKKGNLKKMCNGNLGHGGWDILHLNAIDKFPDGDYLISSRHTDALYKISHHNGSIMWRLGGVKSDFELLGNAKFSRQHHARVHLQNDTHTIVSLFDNARGDGRKQAPTNKNSRGLVLSLRTDMNPMTAEIIAEYEHPLGRYTTARGSVQLLPDKNAFVCWSGATLQSEHTPDGRMTLEAQFKLQGANSYRSYKFPWVGRPQAPPDVHSVAGDFGSNGTSTLVHVSWNGATDVAYWNMYKTDADGNNEELIGSTARQGFETVLSHQGYVSFIILEAVDASARTLGRSNVQKTIPPANPKSFAVIEETQWLQDHTSLSNAAIVLRDPILTFFFGVTSCAAVGVVLWAYWRSKKTKKFWPRSQKQAYEPLSVGDEECKDFGDSTLVDEESDGCEKPGTPGVSVRACSPC
jgi:hypothetical protein